MVGWKDRLLETFAGKTVRDRYLATARAAFAWALDNEHVEQNPFSGVKVRLRRPRGTARKASSMTRRSRS